jgi:hypothetical protein
VPAVKGEALMLIVSFIEAVAKSLQHLDRPKMNRATRGK